MEKTKLAFTKYHIFVISVLGFLQFTIILDFMVLSPLGALLMPTLDISPAQFGLVVSAYAFSAGISGFLAAGFADKFDRKKILLFFYSGFIVGTLFCGLANSYQTLLIARMVTGIFGGVIGSIVMAITTDLFSYEIRGRVMGVIQTAFAASQVLGLPFALYLSNHLGWHWPFFLIVIIGSIAGVIIFMFLKPVDAHLKIKSEKKPFRHLMETISNSRYIQAFATVALLSTGGFMLMPFGSAFSVNNLKIPLTTIPLVYLITGICNIITGPIIGKFSDSVGKFKMFLLGSILTIVTMLIYTNLGETPVELVIAISAIMFMGISARMISSQALISGIPSPDSRGAFMSVSSSIQQISGGIASAIAGFVVVEASDGHLEHFDTLGYIITASIVITVTMMFFIQKNVNQTTPNSK